MDSPRASDAGSRWLSSPARGGAASARKPWGSSVQLFVAPPIRQDRWMKCLALALAGFSLLLPSLASAQECDCEHVVVPATLSINGAEMGVEPGESVCIEGGAREFLRVYEMTGTEESPIVIKNCDGQVVIDNDDRGYGLTLEGSSYVQITGTGDAAFEYGFSVRASKDGPDYSASCIIANAMTTDYEIDHIEAFECGFAGVSAKTDPTCDDRDLSSFVQRNSRLHHLYLHDTGGEGIYFGSTGYPSRTRNCDGTDVELIPHSHEGVWIHDNIIEDTGWDGAQIGVSPKACYFYRNRIARVGLSGEQYQMQGLQLGGSSACEVFDNFMSSGPATGIIVLDAADTKIYNNVIIGFEDGIYINDRDSEAADGASYFVVHNTVASIASRGITIFGSRSVENAFVNNLLVEASDAPLGIGGDVDAVDEGNLILEDYASAMFVDAPGEDFQLAEGAPGIDAGVDASLWEITTDQLGAMRDGSPDAGAFEFGADAPSEPNLPPGPGSVSGSDGDGSDPASDGGESSEEGGCSCRSTGRSRGSSGPWALLGIVGFWAVARARRVF